jgi:dipeptidyl aminopeptidase/acylaminoacyl peptidase
MRWSALLGGMFGGFLVGTIFFKGIEMQAYAAQQDEVLIPRQVLFGNPDKLSPQISPDGTKLAYIAPYKGVLNVWVRTLGHDDDTVVTNDTHRGIRTYFWRHDNAGIIYLQDKNGNENWHVYMIDCATHETKDLTPLENVQARILKYRKEYPLDMIISLNHEDKRLHDAYKLNLATGELVMIAKNPGDVISWHVDDALQVRGATKVLPDGGSCLQIRKNHKTKWHTLITWNFDDAGISGFIGFAKQGKSVYLQDAAERTTAALVSMDIASGAKTVLAHDNTYDAADLFVHPDTREPIAAFIEKERMATVLLDPAYEADFAYLRTLDRGDMSILNYDHAFTAWIVAFVKDDGPTAYYIYNRATKQAQFLFNNRSDLDRYKLVSMIPITFAARDGLTLHGYITQPAPCNDKKALVVLVHGGPQARDSWGFNPQAQWLANRGITCLQLNYRGSTGYGKAFINAGNKEWGGKMHDDLIDGVNWAIAQGFAEAGKVAIFGGSYGGFAALTGVTATPDVFCCAVDMCGRSNLLTHLEEIPPYWHVYKAGRKKRIGDPETESALLKERSPLFKAHLIKKPLLIAQGAHDPRVKQNESEQIVAAMKANNIAHEYMLFDDEGHGLAKPENQLAFYAAAEKFLHAHMGCRYQG